MRSGVRYLLRKYEVSAKQRGHRALPHWYGLLHCLPAQLQELGGGRKVERAGCAKCGIFAEAMPGDEIRSLRKVDATVFREGAEYGDRMRHNRGLRIFSELQLIVGAIAHEAKQVLAERFVDFLKHVLRGPARLGERCAHTNGLAALPRKNESAHLTPLIMRRG
ncbi:hypothetical protein GCM10022276_27700 [Sphingomonas limnosediminicola]|uniref:Transposase n=1 Tax=Sphingomonas limnosediminicola TaxID=940133 RepID=A0ABP7LY59_9SPHN